MSLSPTLTVKELLLFSCVRDDLDSVRALLRLGADVNWRDGQDVAGLHLATSNNSEEMLDLLLTYVNIDVNVTESNGLTPLMMACLFDQERFVRKLCRVETILVDREDGRGQTALHQAVVGARLDCVRVLLQAGAGLTVRTRDGSCPLTLALREGHADVLQILLSVPDLDLSVTDGGGRNVGQIAVEEEGGERQRCVEMLSRDRRVDWNIKNSDGDTPVMFCLKTNKIEMARCLINTPGVDLDTVDRDGKYLETIAR